MRFNEKLQILRKEKKLSQEQLADMLDVTRQSVSKWESGTTYPEMDKLIMLSKIFGCSLDDLTNDEIVEINMSEKNLSSFSLNNLLDGFLGFIGKTVNMITSMSFKQIVGCAFTMFVLALFLMAFNIPFDLIKSGFANFMGTFGYNTIYYFSTGMFNFILNIIFVALYFIVLIYVFKVAYLDKYKFVESEKSEVVVKKETVVKDSGHENIEKEPIKEIKILNNPNPKENILFKVLGGMILGFVKFLVACFSIPVIFITVILCGLLVLSIYAMFNGVIFIGIVLAIIFAIIACIWFLELVSVFLFNKKLPFKRLLWTFIVLLVGLGVSFGITVLDITKIKYVEDIPSNSKFKESIIEEVYDMTGDFTLDTYYSMNFIEYVEDANMTNKVRVEVYSYKEFVDVRLSKSENVVELENYYLNDFEAIKTVWSVVVDNLKNKTIYNYDAFNNVRIVVYSSKENISKIKTNNIERIKKIKEQFENERQEATQDSCDSIIDEYEMSISDYERQIEELVSEKEILQEKVDELQEYKNQIEDITSR